MDDSAEKTEFGGVRRAEIWPQVLVPPPFEKAYFASPSKGYKAYIFLAA